jgi:DNA gyrase subunit A
MLITDDGTIIRTPASDISRLSRSTQGVRLMRVAEGCKVVSVSRAAPEEEPEAVVDEPAEVVEEGATEEEKEGTE